MVGEEKKEEGCGCGGVLEWLVFFAKNQIAYTDCLEMPVRVKLLIGRSLKELEVGKL